MKIVMLAGAPGSVDGLRVASYEAGREYDLTATVGARDLAAAFVGAGLAQEVGAKPMSLAEVGLPAGDPGDSAESFAPAKSSRKVKAQ